MELDKILQQTYDSLNIGFRLAILVLYAFIPAIYNYGIIRLFRVTNSLAWYNRLIFFLVLPVLFSLAYAAYFVIMLFGMRMPSLSEWLIPYLAGYIISNLSPVFIFISLARKNEGPLILDGNTRKKLLGLLLSLALISIFSMVISIFLGAVFLGLYFAFSPEEYVKSQKHNAH